MFILKVDEGHEISSFNGVFLPSVLVTIVIVLAIASSVSSTIAQTEQNQTDTNQTYNQTDTNQTYNQTDTNQTYNQTDTNQTYNQTDTNQTYNQTDTNQTYNQTDTNQTYNQTDTNQTYNQTYNQTTNQTTVPNCTIKITPSGNLTRNVGQFEQFFANFTNISLAGPPTYQWTVDGSIIKDYQESTNFAAFNTNNGTFSFFNITQMGPNDYSNSNISFYWLPDPSQVFPNNAHMDCISCRREAADWLDCPASINFSRSAFGRPGER